MSSKKKLNNNGLPRATPQLPTSNLVGSIVEKGFTTSSSSSGRVSSPEPSVLPFPVARHRSHGGPLWKSSSTEELEVEEENEAYPIADFAEPLKRRPKKGLDFSMWRNLVQEGNSEISGTTTSKAGCVALECGNRGRNEASEICSATNGADAFASGSNSSFGEENRKFDQVHRFQCDKVDTVSTALRDGSGTDEAQPGSYLPQLTALNYPDAPFSNFDSNKSATLDSSLSNMSDVGAESADSILQAMSPDEIVEAQNEIKKKFKPGIIDMLKKRGQKKMAETNKSGPESKGGDLAGNSDFGYKLTSVAEEISGCGNKKDFGLHGIANLQEESEMQMEMEDLNTNLKSMDNVNAGNKRQELNVSASSVLDTWSKRVEAVRALRFTFDGSIVAEDSSQYSVKNVAERDLLRTEGDPSAAGYSIKEALELVRSIIPGQRVLALLLLGAILEKALFSLQQKKCEEDHEPNVVLDNAVDWEAVWAYATGPEPELVPTLRITLDDNHVSVLRACSNVIRCLLCCNLNETYFTLTEHVSAVRSLSTAPIFRAKSGMDVGFLGGNFWKYSTKPSNILPLGDEEPGEGEEEQTIRDDIVVAEQDLGAGFIRMGLLPRILYLLEMYHISSLEECLILVLIALVRHSPSGASSVMTCPRLIDTLIKRFIKKQSTEVTSTGIKSVHLLRVLAESSKKNCERFMRDGIFNAATFHLFRGLVTLEQWTKSGQESCALESAMLVEQLRFWKVCLCYGYCISYFSDFFAGMCLWLSPPPIGKLIESNLFCEFTSVSREAYSAVEVLCKFLPHVNLQLGRQGTITWSWDHVLPLVDIGLQWVSIKSDPSLFFFSDQNKDNSDAAYVSFHVSYISVVASVLHMISTLLEQIVASLDTKNSCGKLNQLDRFSDLVLCVGHSIMKNLLDISSLDGDTISVTKGSSLLETICYRRLNGHSSTLISSSGCIHGSVRVIILLHQLLQALQYDNISDFAKENWPRDQFKHMKECMAKFCEEKLENILVMYVNLVSVDWHNLHPVGMSCRGGPAPGLGFGWGSSGGGYWSSYALLAEVDVEVVVSLANSWPLIWDGPDQFEDLNWSNMETLSTMPLAVQKIKALLVSCTILGPANAHIIEKAFHILLSYHTLKSFCSLVYQFLRRYSQLGSLTWVLSEDDYQSFSKALNAHFKSRWLTKKKKTSKNRQDKGSNKKPRPHSRLGTISEETVESADVRFDADDSLVVEWARQRLPLPPYWFISPLAAFDVPEADPRLTLSSSSSSSVPMDTSAFNVVQSGLYFLLGLEALSSFCLDVWGESVLPISDVPVEWKFHALSMVFLVVHDVPLEEKSRDMIQILQNVYGRTLDDERGKNSTKILKFEVDIHPNYSKLLQILVEQFASMSYGDVLIGRQIALYLHQSVELSVRLAAWKALSDAHVLYLLPKLEDCIAKTDGYLLNTEEDPELLAAYVESWTSGKLDKAAIQKSVSFTLAMHHLAVFFFSDNSVPADHRNKLVRSLLRDYSRRKENEGMLIRLLHYEHGTITVELNKKFEVLSEACGDNSTLLVVVEKLRCAC